jgi:DNA-binding NtrC family response regulator
MSFDVLDALLEEVSQSSSQSDLGPTSSRKPLLLIIDDDSEMLESLHSLFSKHYRVISSVSATEGVRLFTSDVCIVILDVKMHGNDGFWACDQIRKLQPDVPIIFYSAYQDAKNPFDIINMHRPFAYIMKDSDPTRLLNIVEVAVRLYHSTLRSRRIIEQLKRKRQENSP